MKYLPPNFPTLLSILLLLVAATMLFRIRLQGALLSAGFYLAAQAFCTTVAWWMLLRHQLENPKYMRVFALAYGIAVLFAVIYAFRMAWTHPLFLGSSLISSALFLSVVIAGIVLWQVHLIYGDRTIPTQIPLVVIQGIALFFCGTVTLVALFTELSPALRITTTALGCFWFALGVLSYAYALGILRSREVWLHLNDVIPAFLAIATCIWMSWRLSHLQGELSPQTAPHESWALHTAIVQAGYAFSSVVNFGKELLQ